jgi:outer membrane protein assembly factor BamB
MGETIPSPTPGPWQQVEVPRRRPRVWPGILIVLLYWGVLKLPGRFEAEPMTQFMVVFFGAMIAPALFLLWWVFFSRVPWADRFIGLLGCAAIGAGAFFLADHSFQQTGMFAPCFYMLPVVFTGWVLWLFVWGSLSRQARLVGLFVVFALTFGYFTTVRFEGTTGAFDPQFSYRWVPTAEQKFLAERASRKSGDPSAVAAAAVELGPDDWPGFRGPARDAKRPGVRLGTDWKQHPPKELWRHRIGPGWSSFSAVGGRLYTQEQRDKDEVIVCYDAGSGNEVWVHADTIRFDEAMSGTGPRATPTFHAGKIYALGAKGQLNCLDAATGKKVWSADVAKDSGAEVPIWGFSASPLVVNDIVTVFAGHADGKSVLGYGAESGKLAWSGGNGTGSYCSTQLAKLGGVEQLLVAGSEGMTSLEPGTGKVLWEYEWNVGKDFNRVTQPTVVSDTDVLLGTGFGNGTHRVKVSRDGDKWTTEKVWETRAISPYYNDLVVHKGHIYGFHNTFFVCVDLETGKQKWKERGYENGQVLLLPDQDLLMILSEKGEVALVEAKPDARKELGKFQAISGKTWNHPVVANGKLFVRNGEEMACYELPPEGKAVAGK